MSFNKLNFKINLKAQYLLEKNELRMLSEIFHPSSFVKVFLKMKQEINRSILFNG